MCRAEPNITVVYPCDGVSTEKLVGLIAYHPGPAYMRTSRPKTPVIYGNDETFTIGGLKVLRESTSDVATVIGAGVTVFEALKAYDQLKAQGTNIRVIDHADVGALRFQLVVRLERFEDGDTRADDRRDVRGALAQDLQAADGECLVVAVDDRRLRPARA